MAQLHFESAIFGPVGVPLIEGQLYKGRPVRRSKNFREILCGKNEVKNVSVLQGPDSHYGTKGLRRIVHQSPSSGCVTFQFTYAAGNNNG